MTQALTQSMTPALDFLLTRRSRPLKMIAGPAPDRDQLRVLLTAAARSPDHGKLEPWRFIVLGRAALDRLADRVVALGAEQGRPPEEIEKLRSQYAGSPLAVVVVSSPKPSDKIPEFEQLLSSGAVCLSLLNAALASGWAACWLTGWGVYDARFRAEGLGLAEGEQVAGVVHIGTTAVAVPDRPRPDIDALITWAEG